MTTKFRVETACHDMLTVFVIVPCKEKKQAFNSTIVNGSMSENVFGEDIIIITITS